MKSAVYIVVLCSILLYRLSLEFIKKNIRILTNMLIYIKTMWAIFSRVLFTTHIHCNNNTCKFSCWIDGMDDLRLLCCSLFVNLKEIQDIIFHNLYIFNKCRIFVCYICLICLTVVLFFWIVIVSLFALIDFVLSFNVIEIKQA